MRIRAFPRRVPFSIALLSLCFWPFSDTELYAQSPQGRASSKLESTVDIHIKPGDDFFVYANGAWLKAAAIPASKDRWSVRDDINELTRRQVATILDDASTSRPGSLARKVADFHSDCAHSPARQHHAR